MAGGGGGPRVSGGESVGRLFAASARNIVPRLVSNVSIAAVGAFYVGPALAALWFVAVWTAVFSGVALMNRMQAKPESAPRLMPWMTAANFVSSTISASMPAALWASGDTLARAFALVTLFIAAAYVLLHYYANVRAFLLLISPSAAVLAFIGADFVLERGLTPLVAVCLAAGLATLVNFFVLSRSMLDSSRSALRRARAQARDGAEAAEAANHAKSAFLATMSHEIRTPLNGVLGMAQAMAASPLSDVQRDRLSVIHQSGEALLAILNDILDLSKIEAGKLELEEIEFDLGELAKGAHSAFTALANKKGLSFALDIEAARGVYRGDPTRLRQILYNLISNALKFTERGEIRVTADYGHGGLEISVADTGVGIAPQALKHLFAKFSQGDASTTRRFGGTGLGLAICQELSRLMGGEISVASELGRGTCFTLLLPLPRVAEARPAPTLPSPDAPPAPETLGVRVLAAEDNSVNQLVLKTLLHQIGVEPVVVSDGEAAVDAWETSDWDVILMDIQMPVMDGPTATHYIRQREAETGRRRTPIIALTANAMSHQVSEYLDAGMDGHVAKPIEAARLFEALQSALVPAEQPTTQAVA
jgi:signal transduction histidine kinase/ActR/RegA family two-component response regulator